MWPTNWDYMIQIMFSIQIVMISLRHEAICSFMRCLGYVGQAPLAHSGLYCKLRLHCKCTVREQGQACHELRWQVLSGQKIGQGVKERQESI